MVLVVMFLGAISFDLWSGFATRRDYAGAADQAAQAGANALDESLFRSTGERKLDPAASRGARQQTTSPRRASTASPAVAIDATADQVVVELTATVDVGLLRIFGGWRPPRRPRPRRRTTTRGDPMRTRAVVVTAILLVVAACSDDDDADPTTTDVCDNRSRVHDRVVNSRRHQQRHRRPLRRRLRRQRHRTSYDLDRHDDGARHYRLGAVVQTLGQRRQDLYAAPDVGRIPEVCADDRRVPSSSTSRSLIWPARAGGSSARTRTSCSSAQVEDFDGDTLETVAGRHRGRRRSSAQQNGGTDRRLERRNRRGDRP